ncbi:dethiobiotin synthase [Aquincola sp. MAHUQ-54]|uniref:ATP-dependent dethiobiotin synthetase BioD n=1 Tax=Aquincola agrisoli TaxID=3119538 RepID=A0AAW9Q8L8_9BURK
MARLAGCFVTGTDTEVGKTRVSTGLLHWAARQGWRSAGCKPVAAGTTWLAGAQVNEDVRALRDAGSVALTDAEVGPLQFAAPCAPHIAARLEGASIEVGRLVGHVHGLAARAELIVVEGVGGFCVPFGPDSDSADLAVALGLPVVLVVGLRLGCLSHALLTAEAVRARGLVLAGWVANRIDAGMAHADDNLAALHHEFGRRHRAPCLGIVPWLAQADPALVAAHLNGTLLRERLRLSPPFRQDAP